MPNKQPGSVYKRFENDDELKKRILAKFPLWDSYVSWRRGDTLDQVAEEAELQRRIVEDEA